MEKGGGALCRWTVCLLLVLLHRATHSLTSDAMVNGPERVALYPTLPHTHTHTHTLTNGQVFQHQLFLQTKAKVLSAGLVPADQLTESIQADCELEPPLFLCWFHREIDTKCSF